MNEINFAENVVVHDEPEKHITKETKYSGLGEHDWDLSTFVLLSKRKGNPSRDLKGLRKKDSLTSW